MLDGIPTSWSGTAEDLADELGRVMRLLNLDIKVPSVRTIRLWRTKRLLGKDAKGRFTRRQILEALAATILFERGWSTSAIADAFASSNDSELERIIREVNPPVDAVSLVAATAKSGHRRGSNDVAEQAAVLLAQGILLQYRRILPGREIIRQDDTVPSELQSAMSLLGRLYIEQGAEDRAACIHDVLSRSRCSLNSAEWGIEIFQTDEFRFGNAVLIEPSLKVPTADCEVIAMLAGKFGEDNLVEYRLHNKLREAAERLAARRHAAYTGVRELLVRHPLIEERALVEFLDERSLSPLQRTVVDEFYDEVPEAWLIQGRIHRCSHCSALMRPHPDTRRFPGGVCPIRQCAAKWPPKVGARIDPAVPVLIAKPQVLAYWVGPGIDELQIYDEARRLGLDAELYPEADQCDVSIGGRIVGIDVKSYSSPVSLGLRLNSSIGGMIHYQRRIIAIGDDLFARNPDYGTMVRSMLEPRGEQSTLEIMDVSSVIAMLKEVRRASEA